MSLVEEKYNEALDQMTGMERVQRTIALFEEFQEILTFQVTKDFAGLSDREIKKKVAERLYMSDTNTLALLERI